MVDPNFSPISVACVALLVFLAVCVQLFLSRHVCSLGIVFMALMISTMFLLFTPAAVGGGEDRIPFTFDEWAWAIKDGYLDTMFLHYLRNGGL